MHRKTGFYVYVEKDVYEFPANLCTLQGGMLQPLSGIDPARFETPAIFKALIGASRALAELKGLAASIPNQNILINTLTLQHAHPAGSA